MAQFCRPLLSRSQLALAGSVGERGTGAVRVGSEDRHGLGMAFDQPDLLHLCLRLHRRDGRVSPGAGGRPAAGQRDLLRGRFQRARRCAVPDRPVFPRRQCGTRGGRRRQVAVPDRGLRLRRGVRRDQGRRPGAICLAVGLDRVGRHGRLHGLEHQAGAGGRALRQPVIQSRREPGGRRLWRVCGSQLRRQPSQHGGDRGGPGAGRGRDTGQQRGDGGRAESRGRDPTASGPSGGSGRHAAADGQRPCDGLRRAGASASTRTAAGSQFLARRVEPDSARRSRPGETGRCGGDGPCLAGGRARPSRDRRAGNAKAGTFDQTGTSIARENPRSCRESISRAEAEGLRYTHQQARRFHRAAPSGRFFSCRTSRARTSII